MPIKSFLTCLWISLTAKVGLQRAPAALAFQPVEANKRPIPIWHPELSDGLMFALWVLHSEHILFTSLSLLPSLCSLQVF